MIINYINSFNIVSINLSPIMSLFLMIFFLFIAYSFLICCMSHSLCYMPNKLFWLNIKLWISLFGVLYSFFFLPLNSLELSQETTCTCKINSYTICIYYQRGDKQILRCQDRIISKMQKQEEIEQEFDHFSYVWISHRLWE